MAARRPVARPTDSYLAKIITYIPTEIIAAYVAISGLIKSLQPVRIQYPVFWIVAGILLLITPLWILSSHDRGKPRQRGHALAATLAFAAWVFATGGPFNQFLLSDANPGGWYHPTQGSIVLIIVCLLLPRIGAILRETDRIQENMRQTAERMAARPGA
jgi:hypothetical protein